MLWILAWLLSTVGSMISGIFTICLLATVFSKAYDENKPINKTNLIISIAMIFLTVILGWSAWASAQMY